VYKHFLGFFFGWLVLRVGVIHLLVIKNIPKDQTTCLYVSFGLFFWAAGGERLVLRWCDVADVAIGTFEGTYEVAVGTWGRGDV
jgi:hypothetical protein